MSFVSRAAVITGVGVGVGFMVILSVAVTGASPRPPDMFMIVDGKSFKAGYGSYGGIQWGGGGFGADVDSSRTLPQSILNATNGSEIQILSPGHTKPLLSQAWVYDQDRQNQFFLEKVSDNSFKITDDVTEGDYVITFLAQFREGMITSSYYHHKIRIS
ncbi:MAG TPA: hypothetical protein VJP79_02275 [Nitrososphaera sp.]|nr:hypothetical protein [Nitrososphaera sp.]